MGIKQASTEKGRESARGLHRETREEEREVERDKGSHLKKGAERFKERSKSSDGKGPGVKQRD
ncbi:MAG: hypothetical protein WDZ83_12315 [Rhizobiaceae bacterium]